MEQMEQMETTRFEPIVVERTLPLSAPLQDIKVEINIYPSDAQKLLADYCSRMYWSNTVEGLEAQQALPQGLLNQLRHENTSYDALWQQLERNQGYSEDVHQTIRTEYNKLIPQVCQDSIFSRVTDHVQEQKHRLQEIERTEQARRVQKENTRFEQKIEHTTKYALTVKEAQQLLIQLVRSIPGTYRDTPTAVLQTYTLLSKDMKWFVCTLVYDSYTWFNFDALGCSNYNINHQDESVIKNFAVLRRGSDLGKQLRQCEYAGELIRLGQNEMLLVDIGGGRVPIKPWNELRQYLLQKVDKQKQEHAAHLVEEDNQRKRLAQEYRLEYERRLQHQEAVRRRIHNEWLEAENQERQRFQKRLQELQERAEQRQWAEREAAEYDHSLSPMSYAGAVAELSTVKRYLDEGASKYTIWKRTSHLRQRCEESKKAISLVGRSTSTTQSSTDGAAAGAVIGGILGLFGGPLGLLAGAYIGGVIGGASSSSSGTTSSSPSITSEEEKWIKLIQEIDHFIKSHSII